MLAVVNLHKVSSGRPHSTKPMQPWRKVTGKPKFSTLRSQSRTTPRQKIVFGNKRGRKGLRGKNSLLPPHAVIFADLKASKKKSAAKPKDLQSVASFHVWRDSSPKYGFQYSHSLSSADLRANSQPFSQVRRRRKRWIRRLKCHTHLWDPRYCLLPMRYVLG